MIYSLLRIFKFSLQDISRNIWLSIVTVLIMILALFSVNMLLVVKVIGDASVEAVKEKIDINLFIKSHAEEAAILALKARISQFEEVAEIVYISKAEALQAFQEKHRNNPEILEALRQIGKNPLTPILIIKPKNLDVFETLNNKLNTIDDEIIESRDFSNYKLMIEKIDSITARVSEAGLALSAIFIFITLLVIYNTVRVALYTHKMEIMIMRLVGASKSFIQLPFLLSSVIYTLLGVFFIMLIFYLFLSLLQPYLEVFFVDYRINIIEYFYRNALTIFGLQFAGAALINIIASYLAVRKYSKV